MCRKCVAECPKHAIVAVNFPAPKPAPEVAPEAKATAEPEASKTEAN